MSFVPWGLGQPIATKESELICLGVEDSQLVLRWGKERQILQEQVKVLEERLRLMEKEKELAERELEIQGKLTKLAEREAQIYKDAFEREKDLTDRALKLAEQSKTPSIGNWSFYGIAALAVFVAGMAAGGL